MSRGPLMVDLRGPVLMPEERELIAHPNVGGVILFSRNYEDPVQLAALCRRIAAVGGPELLIAVDHEGGRVQRFREGFSPIPPMREIGRLWQQDRRAAEQAAWQAGRTIAGELGRFGIDLCFAPVLDLDHGRSAVIGDRAFHGEHEVVARLATAFAAGLAECGMAATGKHFPGHGYAEADSHVALPVDDRDWHSLAGDIAPFLALIRAGLPSLMMAHVVYPAVDELPASLSRRWIVDLLRKRLGFDGAVFCDDLSMHGACAIADPLARAEAALEAGCDMLPVCNDPDTAALLAERLAPGRREASAQRLARLKRTPGPRRMRTDD